MILNLLSRFWIAVIKSLRHVPVSVRSALAALLAFVFWFVIHRSAGYLQISMGNHKVTMLPQLSTDSGIRIYHYNIRGKQQFLEKMINGGRQLEQHKGRHGGRHWRYFYKLYKEGKLEAEYDRVIGKKNYDVLYNNGFIYKDTTIQNIYKQINKE